MAHHGRVVLGRRDVLERSVVAEPDECVTDEPPLREIGSEDQPHQVACHHAEKVSGEEWHRLSEEMMQGTGGSA